MAERTATVGEAAGLKKSASASGRAAARAILKGLLSPLAAAAVGEAAAQAVGDLGRGVAGCVAPRRGGGHRRSREAARDGCVTSAWTKKPPPAPRVMSRVFAGYDPSLAGHNPVSRGS